MPGLFSQKNKETTKKKRNGLPFNDFSEPLDNFSLGDRSIELLSKPINRTCRGRERVVAANCNLTGRASWH